MGKLEPEVLLVEMENGVGTLENSMVFPQRIKHRITIWPSNFTPRYISRRIENREQIDTSMSMFTEALFTIAKR